MKYLSASIIFFMTTGHVMANIPKVVTDIAPIHSLVARVMGDLGTPKLLIPANATPHEYALRPSEAESLQEAELIFWMGEGLTPWLERTMTNLPKKADVVELLDLPETNLLPFRQTTLFGHHQDDDHDHDRTKDKSDPHKEDGHQDDAKHEKEKAHHDGGSDDDHGHGAHDPHAWLSPDNAKIWLQVIAQKLSQMDPDHQATYLANAAEGQAEIDQTSEDITKILKPIMNVKYVVFHDAYQYFEQSFGISVSGALSLGDASAPSPSRIEKIQHLISQEGITCVLAEPQYNPKLVAAISGDLKTGILDPLGARIKTEPKLFHDLLRNMAKSFAKCA